MERRCRLYSQSRGRRDKFRCRKARRLHKEEAPGLWRKTTAVVLCMDVGFSMSNSAPGEESPFEQAKKVMTMFVQRQVFAENKDEVSLVLFGTERTSNSLASGDQYQHITVHRHLMLPDFDLLEDIQNLTPLGSEQGDILDALIVCMDLLQKEHLPFCDDGSALFNNTCNFLEN
ncbi:hypothetical protein E2320_020542 [Naja naja]|nr:hypothetical protein E2320_020542 [Naja naja]